MTKDELLQSIHSIRDNSVTKEHRKAVAKAVATATKCKEIVQLCKSDMPAEIIADMCLRWRETRKELNHTQLLWVVQEILRGTLDEATENILVYLFEHNCRHEAGTDLLFYAEDYFDGNPAPSPEEIVSLAIKPPRGS